MTVMIPAKYVAKNRVNASVLMSMVATKGTARSTAPKQGTSDRRKVVPAKSYQSLYNLLKLRDLQEELSAAEKKKRWLESNRSYTRMKGNKRAAFGGSLLEDDAKDNREMRNLNESFRLFKMMNVQSRLHELDKERHSKEEALFNIRTLAKINDRLEQEVQTLKEILKQYHDTNDDLRNLERESEEDVSIEAPSGKSRGDKRPAKM